MKNILLFFLVLGLVFAGPFPEYISGTDLTLVNYEGTTLDGFAEYSNYDDSLIVDIATAPMTQSEWEQSLSEQEYYGINQKTINGIEYYYSCDNFYGEMCYSGCYVDGTAYVSMVFSEEYTEAQSIDLAIYSLEQIHGKANFLGICPCPIALALIGLAIAGASRISKN